MDIKAKGFKKLGLGALAALVTFSSPLAYADDLEVFINPGLASVTPNLIFVLDLSASMNKTPAGTTPSAGDPSRLDIMKNAISTILSDPNLPDIKVGFTSYRDYSGSGIKFPAALYNSDASLIDSSIPAGMQVKDVIDRMVQVSVASQETPTVPAMYEVARYLRGEVPYFGTSDSFGSWNVGANRYYDGWRAAHPASMSGGITGGTFYVPLDNPTGWNSTCYDYAAYPGGSSYNSCSGPQSAGAELSCQAKTNVTEERVCTTTQCDSGCGTVCSGGTTTTYSSTPPSSCITNSSGNIWNTSWSGGTPTRCCTSSDAGKTECLSTTSYSSSTTCSGGYVCNTSRDREGSVDYYNQCTYRRDSDREDTRRYISPITEQCQKTGIVLLTDGDPSSNSVDYGRTSSGNAASPYLIRNMIASADPSIDRNDVSCDDYSASFGAAPMAYPYANCGKELAEFLHEEDQGPSLAGTTVDTYAIGFGLTGPAAASTWGYLNDVADAGGGDAFEANDLNSLIDAFRSIISQVSSSNQRFSGFAASFDTTTLQTEGKAYLTLFNPKQERVWDGNIKGYFIDNGVIKDVTGAPATEVDPNTGRVVFKSTSQSFWSSSPDGNQSTAGGVVSNLNPATRNIFVITNPSETTNVDLNDGNHDLDTGNAGLTAAVMGMPGAPTTAEIENLINWARSQRIGDPLHTQPRTIKYAGGVGDVLYVTTNQGYLHAVDVNNPTGPNDTAGGDELFAFMPYQMVGTLQSQIAGAVAGPHIYGLDGPMTTLLADVNGDGMIDAATDKAVLYFGMRRGGNSYFAVDVTDPYNPRLMWQINGGTPGFERLGQSWSRMTVARVLDGGTARPVLIFGGGYDAAKQDVLDQPRDSAGDDVGMGIYIVDAATGALLNSVGADDLATLPQEFNVDVPAMKYSIPSDVRAEDTDGNGYVDRVYVGDMGAQVWRMDITEGGDITSAGTLSPYMLADFSGATMQDNRRFYYPPSVALTTRNGLTVTSVALGSGYRAHPLNDTVEDRFFAIVDSNVAKGAPTTTPAALTLTDLYDASSNIIQSATGTALDTEISALNSKEGWYITLPNDQKVLARARTFKNTLLFTTFETGVADVCDFTGGSNRFYAVDLFDATGVMEMDTDNDGSPDVVVRDRPVDDQAAILGEPNLVTHSESGTPTTPDPFCTTVFAGSEAVLKICDAPTRVNWKSLQ
jgi:type IV pilus assembly protein PilY1